MENPSHIELIAPRINRMNQALIPTGLTTKRNRKNIEVGQRSSVKMTPFTRVIECRLPLGVHCLKDDDTKKKARNCKFIRCGKYISYYCLGCHQHFCDVVVSDTSLLEDCEGHFKNDFVFMEANFHRDSGPCFVVAHQHLFCESRDNRT